jgi:hypothetical protein
VDPFDTMSLYPIFIVYYNSTLYFVFMTFESLILQCEFCAARFSQELELHLYVVMLD